MEVNTAEDNLHSQTAPQHSNQSKNYLLNSSPQGYSLIMVLHKITTMNQPALS